MKVKIEKEEKGFKPFKLTLTIESEDELRYLWHHFNMSLEEIRNTIDTSMLEAPKSLSFRMGIFDKIDDKAIELGLRK